MNLSKASVKLLDKTVKRLDRIPGIKAEWWVGGYLVGHRTPTVHMVCTILDRKDEKRRVARVINPSDFDEDYMDHLIEMFKLDLAEFIKPPDGKTWDTARTVVLRESDEFSPVVDIFEREFK